ncbi:glycosyltransferase [Candidatus Margulisiibacteriota bacterium]
MNAYIYIPVWGNLNDLKYCIQSIKLNTTHPFYTINLIDDGNPKDIAKQLSQHGRVIKNPENTGFTHSCNEARQDFFSTAHKDDVFILLNSDTLPQKDWLTELIKAKDKYSDTGIFASLTLGTKNKFYGGTRNPLNKNKGLIPLDKMVKTGKLADFKGNKVNPWAEFAAVLISYQCLKKCGAFNEKLIYYGSDAEYCYRANKKGFKTKYISASHVKHKKHSSLKQLNWKQRLQLIADLKMLKILLRKYYFLHM